MFSRIVSRNFFRGFTSTNKSENLKNQTNFFRSYSASATDGEIRINQLLKNRFPKASNVQVNDISGGCGEMYEIKIETVDFVGVRTLKQHKMVTEALKDEVPKMHGLRIFTFIPKDS